jgi:serine-type D-Ala-D-Ala endopeptidase (penicillin-binding protein 7)
VKGILILVVLFTTISAQARTASTWIYNETKKDLIYADRSNITRPIASLTKVMTALVALEHDSDMSKPVTNTSGTKLPPGTNTRGDLFSAMLIRSDNQAAELLARSYPGGRKAFIKAMNDRAQSLGMTSTRFVDPSGLSSGNVSSVGEISTMIQVASLQPIIADTSVLRQVEIKNKKYRVLLDNTNKMLLADFSEIKFSKTGFTNASGWSVGMILERQGQRFVVVVLGARTKEERYNLAKDLIKRHFADIEYDLEQEKQNRGYLENLLGIYRDIWIIDHFLNINEK